MTEAFAYPPMPLARDDAQLWAGGNEYLHWPWGTVLDLEPRPTAVPAARLHTRSVLREWRLPRDLIGDAEMLASELITNALRATLALEDPPPIALRLLANHERLVIEAWDCHPDVPVIRAPAADEDGGRGLAVIEAYSNRWGFRRLSRNVKTVWCELLMPATNP
jgi:anti-sigma regulatory factor (Ser/Thr protein kinase)